jgi:hypothetical protein
MEVEYDQQPTQRDKELAWKLERSKRITSSGLKKLNTPGTKGRIFGDTAIGYIEDIVMQIQEDDLIEAEDKATVWQFQFGHDNEPLAFNWIRENFMEDVKCGTTDFSEILFLRKDECFGDSPDGLVYDADEYPIAWVESKCMSNKKKAIKNTRSTTLLSDVVDEYRDQIIGHFIGNPNVDQGWLVLYNAHVRANGIPYNTGIRFIVNRADFEPSITQTERKIEKVYQFILECVAGKYKPEDVNEWWGLNGKEE